MKSCADDLRAFSFFSLHLRGEKKEKADLCSINDQDS